MAEGPHSGFLVPEEAGKRVHHAILWRWDNDGKGPHPFGDQVRDPGGALICDICKEPITTDPYANREKPRD